MEKLVITDCIYNDICHNECTPSCLRYLETKFLLSESRIPFSKRKVNKLIPDDKDVRAFEKLADIRNNIVDFVSSGKNLYIFSDLCGNGKTTWAIKLMLQYFNEIWAGNGFVVKGQFVNVPTFLTTCKSTISNPDKSFDSFRAKLSNTDLVIFDDIASTKLSEYDYNVLLNYIDVRSLSNKANIYTGNVRPENLVKYVGSRLSSRIYNKSSICVELKGEDMR